MSTKQKVIASIATITIIMGALQIGGSPSGKEKHEIRKVSQASQQRSSAIDRVPARRSSLGVIRSRDVQRPSGHLPALRPKAVPPASAPASRILEEWRKVAVCEEGGWVGSSGSLYPDSLGITADNWRKFGGGDDVSPAANVRVAQRIIASLIGWDVQGVVVYPGFVPDQHGCASW